MLFVRGRGAIRLGAWMYWTLLKVRRLLMRRRRRSISLRRLSGLCPGGDYNRILARPRDRGLDGRIVGLHGGIRGLERGGRGARRSSEGRMRVLRRWRGRVGAGGGLRRRFGGGVRGGERGRGGMSSVILVVFVWP